MGLSVSLPEGVKGDVKDVGRNMGENIGAKATENLKKIAESFKWCKWCFFGLVFAVVVNTVSNAFVIIHKELYPCRDL